jgi:hypothetical protein
VKPWLYHHNWKCGHELFTPQPDHELKICRELYCKCAEKTVDNKPITRDQYYGREPM